MARKNSYKEIEKDIDLQNFRDSVQEGCMFMKSGAKPIKIFLMTFILVSQTLFAIPSNLEQDLTENDPSYLYVKIIGVVKYVIFPGSPDYLSVEGGDEPHPRWILDVDQASLLSLAKVQGTATSLHHDYEDLWFDPLSEPDAHLVELRRFSQDSDDFKQYLKKKVIVKGVLSGYPAHRHVPFVVDVTKVLSHE